MTSMLRPYESGAGGVSKFVSSGLDGRIVVWNVHSQGLDGRMAGMSLRH